MVIQAPYIYILMKKLLLSFVGLIVFAAAASAQSFRLRTNLCYDVLATPTVGVEWLTGAHLAFKLDASYAHWGSEHGAAHKLWAINPEVRWYLDAPDRQPEAVRGGFYVGVGANLWQFNFYDGLLGIFHFPDYTGYQGWWWNAGVTGGYTLSVSDRCALDFNLGLGYNHINYDTFTVSDRTRVFTHKRRTKGVPGVTQVGVNLIIKL
jgi:hypothetical protein